MAEAAPWDAPQQPETPPWGGGNPDLTSTDKTPAERSAIYTSQELHSTDSPLIKYPLVAAGTLSTFAHGGVDMIKNFFQTGIHAAMGEPQSLESEISAGMVAAGMEGGGAFARPGRMAGLETITPIVKQFDDGIIAPAAQRLDSYARAGDPNGVRLEPPTPETVPAPIRRIEGSPFAGIPRSVAAKTGIPEVDLVLNSPVTKAVIDHPVVDRSHDVPYMAGAADPINNPTVFVDRHVPKEQTVGGITFDPADPWVVHENVEQHTMDILIKAGMDDEAAYKVAHFNFAEPAEQAWYRAHGIDQVAAEKEQMTWLPKIQGENTGGDVPASLYQKPYPHDHVPNIDHEPVTETRPTPEEAARGYDIIRNTPELRPKSAQPMLQQARELGVIGDDRAAPSLNELPPKEAGRAAMAATQPPDKVTGEVGGQPERTAWRKRWEDRLDNIGVIGDARDVITAAVDANDEFVPARQGNMSAGQIEQLGSVTGLDTTKIDIGATSSKIKNDVELRNAVEAFRITNDKIKQAAIELRRKNGLDDEAELGELTRLELQRDTLLDATMSSKELIALRAEFARTGHTLNEFYKSMREENGLREFLKDKEGKSPDDVRERARLIADTPEDALPKVLTDRGPKQQPWYYWTWLQGLISGVITHTKYLAVNTGTTYLERVIAPEVAAMIGKARGERVSLMAPLWANVGMVKGLPQAFTAAGQAFKTGMRVPLLEEIELAKRAVESPELEGAKVPYGSQVGPDWGIWKKVFNEDQLDTAAKVLGIPGKSANAIHTFYKQLSVAGSRTYRAYEAAYQEGSMPRDQFWERYNYHLANPTDEALKGSVDDAYSGAFMEKLGEQTGKWAKTAKDNPFLKWLFPFQHIPMNIERMTARYSPTPLVLAALQKTTGLKTEMASAILGEHGAPAQNLAIAKVVVGSSIMGYFINKALSGDANGDYPTDAKERREWSLMNKQANSVKMGDQWVNMERLGPPGNLAKLGANIGAIIRDYDGKDDDAVTKAMWATWMAAVNQIGDEVGFQTLRNAIDAIEDPKKASRFMAWQVGSGIPFSSFLSQNASIMDPDMRVANTLVDGLKYRLPSVRETLLPKRDPIYGEPVHNPGYMSVMRESPINTDRGKAELDRLGYYPTAPQRTIGHVKLNDEQYDRYEATAGPLVKQMLAAEINSPRYQAMPDAAKTERVKGIIEFARARARMALQMDAAHLIRQGTDNRTRQITGTVSTGATP
jgi:hypothetical protein